jgi:hypothetical protein
MTIKDRQKNIEKTNVKNIQKIILVTMFCFLFNKKNVQLKEVKDSS